MYSLDRYIGNSKASAAYWNMLTAYYQYDINGKKTMPPGGPKLTFGGRFVYKVVHTYVHTYIHTFILYI